MEQAGALIMEGGHSPPTEPLLMREEAAPAPAPRDDGAVVWGTAPWPQPSPAVDARDPTIAPPARAAPPSGEGARARRARAAPPARAQWSPTARLRSRILALLLLLWAVGMALPFAFLGVGAYRGGNVVWLAELFGAALGLACCVAVGVTYVRIPRYRRHPNRLLVLRTLADGGVAALTLLVAAYLAVPCSGYADFKLFAALGGGDGGGSAGGGSNGGGARDALTCAANAYRERLCGLWLLPFCFQFLQLSAEGWFLTVLIDVRRSMRNPFYSPAKAMASYHLLAWGLGLLTAGLLVGLRHWSSSTYPPVHRVGHYPRDDDDDDGLDAGALDFRRALEAARAATHAAPALAALAPLRPPAGAAPTASPAPTMTLAPTTSQAPTAVTLLDYEACWFDGQYQPLLQDVFTLKHW